MSVYRGVKEGEGKVVEKYGMAERHLDLELYGTDKGGQGQAQGGHKPPKRAKPKTKLLVQHPISPTPTPTLAPQPLHPPLPSPLLWDTRIKLRSVDTDRPSSCLLYTSPSPRD